MYPIFYDSGSLIGDYTVAGYKVSLFVNCVCRARREQLRREQEEFVREISMEPEPSRKPPKRQATLAEE